MRKRFNRILIIADIEGSSGCWNYRASSFMTPEWAKACEAMTRDVNSVVAALFKAGVAAVRVKDFHRTGYNLLPELMVPQAEIIHGYHTGPVPGIGEPQHDEAVMFLGMHAASGTDGFLAHTLTSRIALLEVNGKPMTEIELFASALAPFGVRPIFFSGCPLACEQALAVIQNIYVFPIDKRLGPERFNAESWRSGLAEAAVASLENDGTAPCRPEGPFRASVKMRAGEAAAKKLANRWKLDCQGDRIVVTAAHIRELYIALIRICYLTPLAEKILPICLYAYNLWGRIGLAWVRGKLKIIQTQHDQM